MVTKSEVFDHVHTHFPLAELGQLGVGLGARRWDRDTEFNELATVIAALNPESDLVADDFAALEVSQGQLSSPNTMPLTINAVRRGVLYRNLPDDAVVNPKIQAVWDNEDGRGIWGDDGRIDALGAGFLLSSFINGLDKGGFPKQATKAILRDQIEHVIKTECAGKASYTAIGALRHLYRVMKYAELHSAESRLLQLRRGAHLVKNFGLQLDDF